MWSLGIILYELCTLKRPFQGENIYSVMKAIMNTKFEEIPNNYSEEMLYIINRCLDKNANTRIDSNALLEYPVIKYYLKTQGVVVGTSKNTRTSIFDKMDTENNFTPGRVNNNNDKSLNESQIETEAKEKKSKNV